MAYKVDKGLTVDRLNVGFIEDSREALAQFNAQAELDRGGDGYQVKSLDDIREEYRVSQCPPECGENDHGFYD